MFVFCREIVNQLRLNAYAESCESPHTKVALLIHLYLSGIDFPNQEYAVDFKSAMDQALRILQVLLRIFIYRAKIL